jgi:hypothetical protein
MTKVGDRVAKVDKLGHNELRGTVTEIHGELIHVKWDDDHESSVIPGPGTLKVLEGRAKKH